MALSERSPDVINPDPKEETLANSVTPKHIVVSRDDLEDPEISVKELLGVTSEEEQVAETEQRSAETAQAFMMRLLEKPFRMKDVRLRHTPPWVTIEDGEFSVEKEGDITLEEDEDPRISDDLPIEKRTRVKGAFQVLKGDVVNPKSERAGHSHFSGGVVIEASGKVYFEDEDQKNQAA
ncbi:MAG: hypothetical protein KDD70_15980 [Bdellovibrionales bacterium]|nr:hypothetical protein [Bdellovibrionales bacterium]